MIFKLLIYLGRLTGLGIFPMARVWNQSKTESYTLYYDGIVQTESKEDKGIDLVPISYCSDELIKGFERELGFNE